MTTFLRKIRHKLIAQSRFRKYLVYALGEIVLVVIGILIALQLNTWNTNRIQKEKERVYLSNIQRDLKDQLEIIEAQIMYEQKVTTIATPIINNYKKQKGFIVDSLFTSSIGILSGRKTFVKISPTYLELISSGNIDIISNNDLKNHIIKYYQDLERNELIINKNNNLFNDAVFIPEVLRLSEMQIIGEFTVDMLQMYNQKNSLSFVDLNEPRLKEITRQQLKVPENELRLINSVNFRNFISVIHLQILDQQKKKTNLLLNKMQNQID